jgi:hypothetical protein
MIRLELSAADAREVREALLETRLPWSPVIDQVTKEIQAKLDEEARR